MVRRSADLGDSLAESYITLDTMRGKIEALFHSKAIARREAERMYEALFLNAFTAFEAFVENLFLGLLIDRKGVASSRRSVAPLVVINSHFVARRVVFNGRKYVDWLPFERTVERANLFFSGGRPFSEVSAADRRLFEECSAIRNAIAHRSRHSRLVFERQVLGSTPLAPRERTPAGYLRSLFRTNPDQTRYEIIVAELVAVARRLSR